MYIIPDSGDKKQEEVLTPEEKLFFATLHAMERGFVYLTKSPISGTTESLAKNPQARKFAKQVVSSTIKSAYDVYASAVETVAGSWADYNPSS